MDEKELSPSLQSLLRIVREVEAARLHRQGKIAARPKIVAPAPRFRERRGVPRVVYPVAGRGWRLIPGTGERP